MSIYGMNVFYFGALLSLTNKLNLTSLIVAIPFFKILYVGYYPIRFKENNEQTRKRKYVADLMWTQSSIISVILVVEYLALMP